MHVRAGFTNAGTWYSKCTNGAQAPAQPVEAGCASMVVVRTNSNERAMGVNGQRDGPTMLVPNELIG